MDKISKDIQRAKISLLLKEPFFGNLLMHLKIIPDKNTPTFSTNGKQLKYSPAYAKKLTRTETSGVLAHEIMHCVFKHHLERGGRDFKLWNEAGDHCINWILIKSGFHLPGKPLCDQRFADMTTVQIYNILASENSQEKGFESGNARPKSGEAGSESINETIPLPSCGEVEDFPVSTESNKSEAIEQESKAWSRKTIQASMTAKLAGKMPAGLDRIITDLMAPKVSWKEILWQFVQETAQEDYSFLRPNRKYISDGIYLPSLYSEACHDIVVAIDTSSSISKSDLNQAASELREIQSTVDATIHVVYADTEVANTQKFEPGDELKLKAEGGGGTDFTPPFKWIEEKQLDIACMIYLTDGYCGSFPEAEPEYPVLWITNRKRWSVPFGEIVEF